MAPWRWSATESTTPRPWRPVRSALRGLGADVARDSAVVCLLGNDLRGLPDAVAFSRQAVRVIRQNLFWALVYNTAGIGLACTGHLNPIVAALAMVLSSLLVTANSLRLGAPDADRCPHAPPVPVGGQVVLREGSTQ